MPTVIAECGACLLCMTFWERNPTEKPPVLQLSVIFMGDRSYGRNFNEVMVYYYRPCGTK